MCLSFIFLYFRHIPNGQFLYPLRQEGSRKKEEKRGREEGEGEGRGDRDPSRNWRGKLTENTIRIRLYGVDAPETAKFGNPGQPYAEVRKK